MCQIYQKIYPADQGKNVIIGLCRISHQQRLFYGSVSSFVGGKAPDPSSPIYTYTHPQALTHGYRRTDMPLSPHTPPAFSNISTFSGNPGMKQKHKSIPHLGRSGRKDCCQLRPFQTTEQRQHWSLWLPLMRGCSVCPLLRTCFFFSWSVKQKISLSSGCSCSTAFKCACIHASACVFVFVRNPVNVARMLILNLWTAKYMICYITQQHFLCLFEPLYSGSSCTKTTQLV